MPGLCHAWVGQAGLVVADKKKGEWSAWCIHTRAEVVQAHQRDCCGDKGGNVGLEMAEA